MDGDAKDVLTTYLQAGREALLWKLEGLSERQARMPMTPTGTNVLGVIKHVASTELWYLNDVFGRPTDIDLPWFADDAEPNADMWATADESREWIVDLYQRVSKHSDATIAALPLDAPGVVPWWPKDRRNVKLQRILLHMIVETNRHAGHVDIIREQLDGKVGYRLRSLNLPPGDEKWWCDYVGRLRSVAESFPA